MVNSNPLCVRSPVRLTIFCAHQVDHCSTYRRQNRSIPNATVHRQQRETAVQAPATTGTAAGPDTDTRAGVTHGPPGRAARWLPQEQAVRVQEAAAAVSFTRTNQTEGVCGHMHRGEAETPARVSKTAPVEGATKKANCLNQLEPSEVLLTNPALLPPSLVAKHLAAYASNAPQNKKNLLPKPACTLCYSVYHNTITMQIAHSW